MCHDLDFSIFHKYVPQAAIPTACLPTLCQGSSVTHHKGSLGMLLYQVRALTMANLNTPRETLI